MRPKRGRWTSALATILLLLIISTLLTAVWYGLRSPVDPASAADVVFVFSLLAFPLTGWLIAVRSPQNPLGWIFLIIPLLIGIGAIGDELGLSAAEAGSDSAAAIVLIVGGWVQFLGYWLLIGAAILLFPDGKIPGNRSRWVFWGLAALVLVWGVTYAIGPERVCVAPFGEASVPCPQSVENPLALQNGAAPGVAADSLVIGIFVLTLGTSVTALALRYIRSTGDVRQQIKWVAWVAAAGLLATIGSVVSQDILGLIQSEWVEILTFSVITVGLPFAIGFSILKYRLYDIDRIISLTAAYAVIVVVLVAVYVASVTVMQRLLPVQSPLGIVSSTLLVAALFNPLRRRVQDAVDRRFNRSRYDARRVLDEFSSQLRDDVDLEQMQIALLSAAHETMQPSHLSLWVRQRGR